MREIKFKVILKKEKSNIRNCWGIDFKEKKALVSISGYFEWHPYKTLIQFTGLKDKNGKEIYEDDIVRLHCGGEGGATSRNGVTATIKWSCDGYIGFYVSIHRKEVKVKGGSSEGKIVSMGKIHSWAGAHYCFSFSHYIEIIGNIHENSELLK